MQEYPSDRAVHNPPEAPSRIEAPDDDDRRQCTSVITTDEEHKIQIRTVAFAIRYRQRLIVDSGLIRHLGQAHLRILYVLDQYVNSKTWKEKGRLLVYPSRRTLAARTGLNPDHVKRVLADLVRRSLLEISSAGGGRRTTRYLLVIPGECHIRDYYGEGNERKQDNAKPSRASTRGGAHAPPVTRGGAHAPPVTRGEAQAPPVPARRRPGSSGAGAPPPGAPQPHQTARQRAPTTEQLNLFESQQQSKSAVETVEPVVDDFMEKLVKVGLDRGVAERLAQLPQRRIADALATLEWRKHQSGGVSNPAGYVRDILENNRPTPKAITDAARAGAAKTIDRSKQAASDADARRASGREREVADAKHAQELAELARLKDPDLAAAMEAAIERAPTPRAAQVWRQVTPQRLRAGDAPLLRAEVLAALAPSR